jgi:hypothetical protein
MNTPALTIHTNTMPDVTEWLPPNAADRLRMLRDHVDDLHRLLPEFEIRRLAGEERLAAEQRLKRLQDHPQENGFALPDSDRRVIAAQRDLKKLPKRGGSPTTMNGR